MDLRRRVSQRLSSSSGAMVHRIEGSKVVLNALEKTKTDEEIAFLKPVAEHATAILSSMRAVKDGELEDDFAMIGLDACGLVFVLIHEVYRLLHGREQIPDRFRWGSDELAEYLRDDIHPFVQKKISRGFVKRHLKHSADDEKVAKCREKLRKWMTKLGINTDASIHDTVETIISEKISNRDAEGSQSRGSRLVVVNLQHEKEEEEVREKTKNVLMPPSLQPPPPPPSDVTKPDLKPSEEVEAQDRRQLTSNVKIRKPLPEIVITASIGTERVGGQLEQAEEPAKEDVVMDKEKERQRRKEEERLARKSERERWRKSEQEFSQLPHFSMMAAMDQDEVAVAETSKTEEQTRQDIMPVLRGPSPQAYISPPSVSEASSVPVTVPEHDEEKDRELALQLQAQLAKEIEEEDARKAMEIGIELHRQWKAEQTGNETAEQPGNSSRSTVVSSSSATSSSRPPTKPERRKAFQASTNEHRRQSSILTVPDTSRPESPNFYAVER